MKYIFDFDDVIFHTTRHRKEHMFVLLEKAGISGDAINEYYQKARLEGLSLKKMLAYFGKEDLYEEIMSNGADFLNKKLIETIKKLGQKNCFLITHGSEEFQEDKIQRAGITPLFSEIIILVGSKKKAVEDICEKYKDEQVVFVDDKAQYFEDLDFKKYPNLKTILYTGQSIDELV